MKNAWTYYVNQLNEADRFIKELTDELSKRDEDTIVVTVSYTHLDVYKRQP